jgi:flavin reductase (DIM6/NTAB) family NADH-FMN oxidoreductase RutF
MSTILIKQFTVIFNMPQQLKTPKVKVPGIRGIMAFPGFPVALVSVRDNILTVAATSFCSFDPPMVKIGIRPENYSYELIQETQDYIINMPTKEQMEAVRICCSRTGRDTNKFKEAKLTPIKGKKVSSYLIEECPVNLECEVIHVLDLKGSHVWFVGEVLLAHIRKDYDRKHALMYWPREYRTVGEVITKLQT